MPTDTDIRSDIISFMDERRAYILSQIPTTFSATSTLATQGGYFRSDEATTADIEGALDSTRTATVLVGGLPATLDVRDGSWSATTPIALQPGINSVPVRAFDTGGQMIWESAVEVWFDTGTATFVSGALGGDTTWTAAGGPYSVTADLVVPSGVTLTIEPGTTVYFADDTRMTVNGRLLAEGADGGHITFARPLGRPVDGMVPTLRTTLEDNRMTYVDMDGADAGSQSVEVVDSRLAIDHTTWSGTTDTVLELDNPQVIVTNSTFPGTDGAEVIHGNNLSGSGFFTLRGNTFQTATGYNDVIDFTGGRRPGPIIYIINKRLQRSLR